MVKNISKKILIISSITVTLAFTTQVGAETYNPYPGKIAAKLVNVVSASVVELEAETWPGFKRTFTVTLPDVQVPRSDGATVCQRQMAEEAKAFTASYLSNASAIHLSGLQMANSAEQNASGQITTNQGSLIDALKGKGFVKAADNSEPWC